MLDLEVKDMKQIWQLNFLTPLCEFRWNCSACFVLTPFPQTSQTFSIKILVN